MITNTSGSQLGNTDLKPERMDEVELGLEGRFFDYRLSAKFLSFGSSLILLLSHWIQQLDIPIRQLTLVRSKTKELRN